MPHRPEHTHINMHIITWACDLHGPHKVVIAGLDSMALTQARRVLESTNSDGWPAEMISLTIPLDDVRSVWDNELSTWAEEEMTHDDLPF